MPRDWPDSRSNRRQWLGPACTFGPDGQSQNETVAPTDEIGAVVRSHLGGEVCAVVIAKQLDAARCFGLVGIHHRVRVAGSGALSAVRLLEVLEELYSAEKPLPRVGRSRRRIHDAY